MDMLIIIQQQTHYQSAYLSRILCGYKSWSAEDRKWCLRTRCSEKRPDLTGIKKVSNFGYITRGNCVPPIAVSAMLTGRLQLIEQAATMGYLQENTMHVRYKDQSVNV